MSILTKKYVQSEMYNIKINIYYKTLLKYYKKFRYLLYVYLKVLQLVYYDHNTSHNIMYKYKLIKKIK